MEGKVREGEATRRACGIGTLGCTVGFVGWVHTDTLRRAEAENMYLSVL